jgi:hypothetical protein
MQLGESAGHAAALSVKGQTTPTKLHSETLIRKLAASRVMISFFNDLDVTSNDPQVVAAQYFATRGFFASYDAKLDEPLTEAVKAVWQDGFEKLQNDTLVPMQLAKAVHEAEALKSPATKETRGEALAAMWKLLSP